LLLELQFRGYSNGARVISMWLGRLRGCTVLILKLSLQASGDSMGSRCRARNFKIKTVQPLSRPS